MHICIASHEFPPFYMGGISTYYSALAKLLADFGHQVTVLTVDNDLDNDTWSYPGIKVVRLNRTIINHQEQLSKIFEPELNSIVFYIATGLAMRDWLRTNARDAGIEIIDAPEYCGTAAFMVDSELPPVVVTCHSSRGQIQSYDCNPQISLADSFFNSLELISLGTADEVACLSPKNLLHWQNYLGRPVQFVTAAFDKIGPQPSYPPRHGNNNSQFSGLIVGRLQVWKGPIETNEALNRCVDKKLPVCIRWIGRDTHTGPGGLSMKEFINHKYSSLWGKNFIWLESAAPPDIRLLQSNVDFEVVPSSWDTLNYSAIEAMSVGTPLIISQAAGASYLCEDGKNALVVPANNPEALADAIERLYLDPCLRNELGHAGHETILKEFEPGKVLQEHVDLYKSAINRHKYRNETPYYSSIMNPIELQWLRSIQRTDETAYLSRIPLRRLVREVIKKLSARLGKI